MFVLLVLRFFMSDHGFQMRSKLGVHRFNALVVRNDGQLRLLSESGGGAFRGGGGGASAARGDGGVAVCLLGNWRQ